MTSYREGMDMNRLLIACVVSLLALCHVTAQQLDQPWKDWEPPDVILPEPNAFELYQQAFDLIEELGEVDAEADPDELRQALEDHALTFRLLQEAMMGECRLPAVIEPTSAPSARRLACSAPAPASNGRTATSPRLLWTASPASVSARTPPGADRSSPASSAWPPRPLASRRWRT